MESNFDDFARDTVKWLQEKYGDRLKSVVVHNDEAHPHLHFTVVPRIGERFDDMHEGYKASRLAKEEGKKKGEQNLAYIEAMRRFQDEFSEKVAMSHGLTRIGPARRRLSRPAWKAEQQQAAYFANLKRIAQIYARKGYEKGMEKARKEAASILDEARKRAESMGSRVSSFFAGLMQTWHEPTAEAKAEKEKAKRQVEQERDKRQKAEKAAKEQADKRIVTIANELQVAKARLEASERELLRLEDENHRFKKRISLEMPQKFEKSAI
jgi:vacuolar-type H+-ATPase subunit H